MEQNSGHVGELLDWDQSLRQDTVWELQVILTLHGIDVNKNAQKLYEKYIKVMELIFRKLCTQHV